MRILNSGAFSVFRSRDSGSHSQHPAFLHHPLCSPQSPTFFAAIMDALKDYLRDQLCLSPAEIIQQLAEYRALESKLFLSGQQTAANNFLAQHASEQTSLLAKHSRIIADQAKAHAEFFAEQVSTYSNLLALHMAEQAKQLAEHLSSQATLLSVPVQAPAAHLGGYYDDRGVCLAQFNDQINGGEPSSSTSRVSVEYHLSPLNSSYESLFAGNCIWFLLLWYSVAHRSEQTHCYSHETD